MPPTGPWSHRDSDEFVPLDEAFLWQAQRCLASKSPVAAQLLEVCAATTPLWTTPVGLPASVRFGDHFPLRVMAALHYLALTREAPELALYLPTVGGTAPAGTSAFEGPVLHALLDNPGTVGDFIAHAPQTNEPGRQAALRLALKACPTTPPVDLIELGCSAGLNLAVSVDQYELPTIASRQGCDLNPIDVHTVDGRARLSAYVWADDVNRFAALGQAIEVAQKQRIKIVRDDAANFVRSLQPTPGHTLLIWTSAFAPYLSTQASTELTAAVSGVAQRMSTNSTLIEAAWEDAGDTTDPARAFALTLTAWHSNGTRDTSVLARGSAHGALAQY